MDDFQAKILQAVKQLQVADISAISDTADIPLSVVRGVCNYLIRKGYLLESEEKYKITSKATRALFEKEREIVI